MKKLISFSIIGLFLVVTLSHLPLSMGFVITLIFFSMFLIVFLYSYISRDVTIRLIGLCGMFGIMTSTLAYHFINSSIISPDLLDTNDLGVRVIAAIIAYPIGCIIGGIIGDPKDKLRNKDNDNKK